MRLQLAVLAALAFAAPAALAQPVTMMIPPSPPPVKVLPMALALEAAQTAVSTCAANGYKVTVVILDAAGDTRLVLSADGASARTVSLATRKAFTAVTLNRPTIELAEAMKTDPLLGRRIEADARMISWAGARPVTMGGQPAGAIAVSGAPGGDKDDACVAAGIAKIADRLG